MDVKNLGLKNVCLVTDKHVGHTPSLQRTVSIRSRRIINRVAVASLPILLTPTFIPLPPPLPSSSPPPLSLFHLPLPSSSPPPLSLFHLPSHHPHLHLPSHHPHLHLYPSSTSPPILLTSTFIPLPPPLPSSSPPPLSLFHLPSHPPHLHLYPSSTSPPILLTSTFIPLPPPLPSSPPPLSLFHLPLPSSSPPPLSLFHLPRGGSRGGGTGGTCPPLPFI